MPPDEERDDESPAGVGPPAQAPAARNPPARFVSKRLKATRDINRAETPARTKIKWAVIVCAGCAAAYWTLGLIADQVALRIPIDVERSMKSAAFKLTPGVSSSPAKQAVANEILRKLLSHAELPALEYEVRVERMGEPNAFALPGGGIVIAEEIFDVVDSEEGLAMVLGHELGHFKNRDHLRRLGRTLLFSVVMGAVGGQADLGKAIGNAYSAADRGYSRGQERDADDYGLELLAASYGHVNGATEFFRTMQGKTADNALLNLFSTHPGTNRRIERLDRQAGQKGYPQEETKLLEDLIKKE
jgi:putative metalloprotease